MRFVNNDEILNPAGFNYFKQSSLHGFIPISDNIIHSYSRIGKNAGNEANSRLLSIGTVESSAVVVVILSVDNLQIFDLKMECKYSLETSSCHHVDYLFYY